MRCGRCIIVRSVCLDVFIDSKWHVNAFSHFPSYQMKREEKTLFPITINPINIYRKHDVTQREMTKKTLSNTFK